MKIFDSYLNTKHFLNSIQLRLNTIYIEREQLSKEERELKKQQEKILQYLEKIDMELKGLNGIEYQLYYEIIVRGLSPTRAIDKVAFDYNKDVSTIWKKYYPNVKKQLQKLETNSSENPVTISY